MPNTNQYRIAGVVELFPQEGGWHYLRTPLSITEELSGFADRGVIAITASVGSVSWATSLLPMGDGSHFVALNAKVMQANDLQVGDPVEAEFVVRSRKS